MKALKSQQTLLLEGVWKKAWGMDEPLLVEFRSESAAHRARMALYNAVRRAKRNEDPDLQLCDAAQGQEISWVTKTSFVIRRIERTDFIQGLETALGEKLGDQMDPVIKEGLKKLEQAQAEASTVIPQFGEIKDPFGILRNK